MSFTPLSIDLEQQTEELTHLLFQLQKAFTPQEKIAIIDCLPHVRHYLDNQPALSIFLAKLSPECVYVMKSIIAIRQAPFVFYTPSNLEHQEEKLNDLLEKLLELEFFYEKEGGIIGYHLLLLDLIARYKSPPNNPCCHYIHPEGLNIDQDSLEVRQCIRTGIEFFDRTAEIYPVGGAGDRLGLIDEKTQIPLPAAMLCFAGRTLFEGLIRDVQAREYLYYKLYNKRLCTPLAFMTSEEKNNHIHILNICKNHNWFGRPSESFFFFMQPLVPVLTKEGSWSLSSPLHLNLKPGGHGVIWKLADDKGVFDWLVSLNQQKAIIRQINNPLAGIDHGLLALSGLGWKENKAFGFASCERFLNSAEGVDILIEKEKENAFEYCLTNIEYTDFAQRGIEEIPVKAGSPFSTYPTNTNILFIDIPTIQQTSREHSIPGKLINMKTKVPFMNAEGQISQVDGGRLESTMQNIADYLIDSFSERLHKSKMRHVLKTFITYNKRIKTISTTKKSYKTGESCMFTPEYVFYELLYNNWNLFKTACKFSMPEFGSVENYLERGPTILILYHPALGPLYSVIAQKIKGGHFKTGAELQIEIAEVDIQHLDLEGSLLIESSNPLGLPTDKRSAEERTESRCLLHHVQVKNKGMQTEQSQPFWKNQIQRQECLKITLGEGSEFEAAHVCFEGNYHFTVPSHHRLIVRQSEEGQLIYDQQPISTRSWYWQYRFDAQEKILLSKCHSFSSTL